MWWVEGEYTHFVTPILTDVESLKDGKKKCVLRIRVRGCRQLKVYIINFEQGSNTAIYIDLKVVKVTEKDR